MIEVELSVGVRGPVTCTQLEGIVFRMVDRKIWVVDWRRWSQDGKDGVKRANDRDSTSIIAYSTV